MSRDFSAVAFLFPGQGSQKVGMGRDLAEAYPIAAQTFAQANDILGYKLSDLCFNGPESTLNETLHTQPALFVAGTAAWRALNAELGEESRPAFAAGHSLGEFTSLVAAGAISFEDGLKLVARRAELMKEAGEKSPGAVAALLGLEIDAVRTLCADASAATSEIVVVANDNCPGQVVISGTNTALDHALTLATERGAKRAVKLAVSVAVHSPLMEPAGRAFAEAVHVTPINNPLIPVVGNVTAKPLHTADEIRAELTAQITASVLWRDTVETILAGGVQTFVELGSGDVLTGLVKRISREAGRVTIDSAEQLQKYLAE